MSGSHLAVSPRHRQSFPSQEGGGASMCPSVFMFLISGHLSRCSLRQSCHRFSQPQTTAARETGRGISSSRPGQGSLLSFVDIERRRVRRETCPVAAFIDKASEATPTPTLSIGRSASQDLHAASTRHRLPGRTNITLRPLHRQPEARRFLPPTSRIPSAPSGYPRPAAAPEPDPPERCG